MRVFDTDILTEILLGNPTYAERVAAISPLEQAVSIVTVEELIRGRLNSIRQAEAGKARVTVERAYALFKHTLEDISELRVLSFKQAADEIVTSWRRSKIKGSTHDLRIAATCVATTATLATRNRRDFKAIPGLSLEIWE